MCIRDSLTTSGTWSGGTLSSTLNVAAGATLSLTGGNYYAETVSGGTLNNSGTITWTGTGNIGLQNTATINNQTGALFNIQTTASLIPSNGSDTTALTFNNAGTLRKSSVSGTTSFIYQAGYSSGGDGIVLNDSGTVDVQKGTLSLQDGGTESGTLTAESGATLSLSLIHI